ncbi:MAG: stage II sporulation protein P [Clostridia bacterium]|nr:stage II sporulation protein P [Clostridia bacterium]
MHQLPSGKNVLGTSEKVKDPVTFGGKYRVFAAFIICAALLGAAFAISSIWRSTDSGTSFFEKLGSFFSQDEDGGEDLPPVTDLPDMTTPPSPESPSVPSDAITVISKDLSCSSLGENYYLNETDYLPDINALLGTKLDLTANESGAPLVLIVHTHTVESYLPNGSEYVEGQLSDAIYSEHTDKNMLAVGKALVARLAENGISALQCTVTHTGEGMSLQGAYGREAESVKGYLKQYPSIRLVIDLHRDSIMTESGEYVRSEVPENGELAQVMAVVGTDSNGTPCEWERNLSLALQLRQALNTECTGLARPVYLRRASFNQELAEYSLLLEVGTGGNSIEQAKRTAERIGDALADLIFKN